MNRFSIVLACAGGLALAGAARAAPSTFVQHLLDVQQAKYPQITQASATSTAEDKPGASPPGATDIDMKDVSGDSIGVIHLTFKGKSARNAVIARRVQAALGRHLISAKNALDPYPYDPAYNEGTYSQALVEKIAARHPEVIILAIHSTPPGAATNIISGSTIGRIGKKADEDDLRVIEKGSTNLEISENKKRFEAEVPLEDAQHRRIGALGVVFRYKAGEAKETLHKRALVVRDEIAAAIPDAAALAKPR